MFSFNQSDFKRNKNSCWLSSQIIGLHNNVLKTPITQPILDRIEKYMREEDKRPMGLAWLTIKAWLDRIERYTQVVLKKPVRKVIFDFWSPEFYKLLDAGWVISVTINTGTKFHSDRKTGKPIVWTYIQRKWGHAIGLYKKDWKYYFLNSRWTTNQSREVDMKVVWLFRWWDCGALLPM